MKNHQRFRTFVADFTRLFETGAGGVMPDEDHLLERGSRLLGRLIGTDDWLPEEAARPHPKYYQQYLLHCDALERFFFRPGTNVDPDIVDLGHFLSIALVHEVNGALAGDAFDRTACGLDDHPTARNHGAIMASYGVKVDEAVLVDVGDDEAELVHVAGKHQHRVALGIQRGDAITQGIVGINLSRRFDVTVEDGLGFALVTRGRTGVEQFAKEVGNAISRHKV